MKYAWAFIVALALTSVVAAEEYEKGPNGGLMLDVAGIDAELLTSGNTVTINVKLSDATLLRFEPDNSRHWEQDAVNRQAGYSP